GVDPGRTPRARWAGPGGRGHGVEPRPLPCSLRRHVSAINHLAQENFFFWDYGNAFLLEAQRAGADVEKKGANKTEFRYPSYVQHIMGDIFSQGFGPFRWVCTSGDPEDLAVTDQLATSVLEKAIAEGGNVLGGRSALRAHCPQEMSSAVRVRILRVELTGSQCIG
ncbi:urocanate hydratase-like, partial [Marmota marmota marmota]|uniref:urocanate hydratase-like n=1 Tax=Marmota marmota marmota TaxID=9994 RepID=UPI0007628F31